MICAARFPALIIGECGVRRRAQPASETSSSKHEGLLLIDVSAYAQAARGRRQKCTQPLDNSVVVIMAHDNIQRIQT